MKRTTKVSWFAQAVAALILGQSLFFKFSGAQEAVNLFTQLGVEPWGRLSLGVVELLVVVMLLVPRLAALGGVATVGIMLGAMFSHLTVLGIEINGDGGALFAMALIALAAGACVTWIRRSELAQTARSVSGVLGRA